MVRISKRVEYALVAIQHMSSNPRELVSARDLSARFSLPANLMAKILQRLASAGILTSAQGVHGGYRLVRDPNTMSFLELSEAVEGPVRPASCDAGSADGCERSEACTVAGPVHLLSERIIGLLAETKIGSLLETAVPGGATGEGVQT